MRISDWSSDVCSSDLFVPLIGAHGWSNGKHSDDPKAEKKSLSALIADAAEPLPDLDDPAFGHLFDRFSDARIVLLGEASHGTSEFYRARAAKIGRANV